MGNSKTITDVLKSAIEKSGLTLYRIAKGSGVEVSAVNRFMAGASIRLSKADKLAAYLGLRLTPDPDAVPPTPTPENLARPMLAKTRGKKRKGR